MRRLAELLTPPLVLLAIWELTSRSQWIDPTFFPAPSTIVARLMELIAFDPRFRRHLLDSGHRLLVGFLVATPAAVTLGILSELNPYVGKLLKPLVGLTYPLPKLALFPLLLVIFGVGDSSKIALIAIGIFFLVLINTANGVRGVIRSGLLDITRVYRVARHTVIFQVIVKGAVPDILLGLKAGIGYGLVMVVASEYTVSSTGVGVFIWNAWDQFKIVDIYCGIFIISLIGLTISEIFDSVEHRLAWKKRVDQLFS